MGEFLAILHQIKGKAAGERLGAVHAAVAEGASVQALTAAVAAFVSACDLAGGYTDESDPLRRRCLSSAWVASGEFLPFDARGCRASRFGNALTFRGAWAGTRVFVSD